MAPFVLFISFIVFFGIVFPSILVNEKTNYLFDSLLSSNKDEYSYIYYTYRVEGTPFMPDFLPFNIGFLVYDIKQEESCFKTAVIAFGVFFLPQAYGTFGCGERKENYLN